MVQNQALLAVFSVVMLAFISSADTTGAQGQRDIGAQAMLAASDNPVASAIIRSWDAMGTRSRGGTGITVKLYGEVHGLDGARIATAAYFYDSDGIALPDADDRYRSSGGQVFAIEYRRVQGSSFKWEERLFLPIDQLHLPMSESYDLQIQLIMWEFQGPEASVLTRVGRAPVTLTLPQSREHLQAAIGGSWSDGVTVLLDEWGNITLDGLDVRGNVESQNWSLDGNRLRGIVNLSRLLFADRVATYNLVLSENRRTLSGTYTVKTVDGGKVKDEGTLTLTR